MTALYATETEFVAPMPAPKRKSNANPHGIHVANACKEQNEDFRPPNRSEAASLFYNQLLVGEQSGWRWTSDIESTTSYDGRGSQWSQDYSSGDVGTFARSGLEGGLRCIRKF